MRLSLAVSAAAALLLAGCPGAQYLESCPPNSSAGDDGLCSCNSNAYGSLTWNEETESYAGACLSGLEEALRTGNSATLEGEAEILGNARHEVAAIETEYRELLLSIYRDDPIELTPTAWSQHIVSSRPEDTFVLVQGSEDGHSLATVGSQGSGRYAAFGFNLVADFFAGGHASYEDSFQRLLSWLVSGSADVSPETSLSVGVAGLGWNQSDVTGWFQGEFPEGYAEACNDPSDLANCFSGRDLLILGSSAGADASEAFGNATRSAIDSGTPILFLHTETWAMGAQGAAVLKELGMSYGGYGGNYWAEDLADWSSVEDMLDSGGVLGSLDRLFAHFQERDFNFDWSFCVTYVGQTSCSDVPGFRTDFLAGAESLKGMLKGLDQSGEDLFHFPGRRLSKLSVLLADWYRERIVYPLDKEDEDVLPFLQAYYADHVVHYRREFGPMQPDQGTFSPLGPVLAEEVAQLSVSVDVDVSRHGGFTAVGYYALPGEPFTVRLLEGAALSPSVRINTHRIGSTREFDGANYNRPKFLASPDIPLVEGEGVRIVSPYGGTIQLVVAAGEQDDVVALELEGVARHPVLEEGGDTAAYIAELADSPFPMTEITNPYVQIHSKVDQMLEAIDNYGGDLDAFFSDLDQYMVRDTYNLAGFVGKGLEPVAQVLTTCDELGWDCTSATIHGRPAVQHINVDYYAHCGGGCSGNPYDQSWALGPLGWGETHEIGHNLQRGRLKIYGGQSSEVSNQIFPLHKHWSWRSDTGESLSPDRVDYEGVFELFQGAQDEGDPGQVAYEAIWADESYAANNGQRMGLWMQMRHFANSLSRWETGWDIFTLMYHHERLFEQAVNDPELWAAGRDALGFSVYSNAGEVDGNDFMLLSYSFLTERDQRPFFELWGVDWSTEAESQMDAYGFEAVPLQMWVSSDTNGDPLPDPLPIDGATLWPFGD